MIDLVIRVFEWEGMRRVVINGCYFDVDEFGNASISAIEELFKQRNVLLNMRRSRLQNSRLIQIETRLSTLPSGHTPQDRDAMNLIHRAAKTIKDKSK